MIDPINRPEDRARHRLTGAEPDRPSAGSGRHRASTAAALDFAWEAGTFRSDHVMAAVGLTRSTTLVALNRLIELGLIDELSAADPDGNSGPGRPARRFRLRGAAGVLIGVDLGERGILAVATDLAGEVLARARLAGAGRPGREAHAVQHATELAFRAVDAALASAERSREDVIGVGVGVPAGEDTDTRPRRTFSGLWQRRSADLRTALAADFPVARVERDAVFAARAERSLGRGRGHDNFVAVLNSGRPGMGVFLDGRPARGAVGDLSVRGTLLPLPEADGGMLGQACRVAACAYDPDLIVVCGAPADVLARDVAFARDQLWRDSELPAPPLVASQLGVGVVALGAACAAREDLRGVALDLFSRRHRG